MAAKTGRRRGNSEMAVTAMAAAQIWICGRGCGKTAATTVTTKWQNKLGLSVASATAMSAARHKQ